MAESSQLCQVDSVIVLLWCSVSSVDQYDDIYTCFDEIGSVMKGTPGLVGSHLLESISEINGFAILSIWQSAAAFERWERGRDHRTQTAPMRSFQNPRRSPRFDVLRVSRAMGGS